MRGGRSIPCVLVGQSDARGAVNPMREGRSKGCASPQKRNFVMRSPAVDQYLIAIHENYPSMESVAGFRPFWLKVSLGDKFVVSKEYGL